MGELIIGRGVPLLRVSGEIPKHLTYYGYCHMIVLIMRVYIYI